MYFTGKGKTVLRSCSVTGSLGSGRFVCVRWLMYKKEKSGFWFRRKCFSLTEVNVKASFVFEDMFSCGISGIAAVRKAS